MYKVITEVITRQLQNNDRYYDYLHIYIISLNNNYLEGKTECSLCGNERENVSHVLWECSACSSTRASFMKKLQELLEDDYEDFESLEM